MDTTRYAVRDDARRFETWENSYALRAGLKVACDYAMDIGLEAIRQRAWGLTDMMREKLAMLPGCRIMDLGVEKCAIISFIIEGLDPQLTVEKLRSRGIAIGPVPTGQFSAGCRTQKAACHAAHFAPLFQQ